MQPKAKIKHMSVLYNYWTNTFRVKPTNCILTYMLCDSKLDCLDVENQQSCNALACPHLLVCRYYYLCNHPINMCDHCDGIIHCSVLAN